MYASCGDSAQKDEARNLLAWHVNRKDVKGARKATLELYTECVQKDRETCMATTRTGNAYAANREAPARVSMHIRVSRLIYAPN